MLAVVLAVVAAAAFAGAASLQQHASRLALRTADVRDGRGRLAALLPVATLARELGRSPLWLLGWTVNLVGFLVQALALHKGSVSLVQPLMVTQLLFALPLASAWCRRWPPQRDWLAATAICAGLGVFLLARGPVSLSGEPDRGAILLATTCTAAVVVALVVAARDLAPARHAALVAVAAGLCFALTAVFVKLTMTDLVDRGVAATATDWPGYALAGSALAGLLLEQEAFAAGSLAAAVAAMTITNPFAGYLLGLFGFHAGLPHGFAVLSGLVVGAFMITAGVLALSASPTVLHETHGVQDGSPDGEPGARQGAGDAEHIARGHFRTGPQPTTREG